MSNFLRRSKSTRDTRRQGFPIKQELPFTSADLLYPKREPPFTNADLLYPKQQVLHRATSTKRSGGIYSNRESKEPGPPNLLKLARRKSISSTRESKMALGLPESWKPPTTSSTITAAERKKRTSIFFGLVSPLNPLSVPPQPKRTVPLPPPPPPPPTPPIRLPAFPPRGSSRRRVNTPTPTTEDVAIGVAIGDENCAIGMALGSPTEKPRPRGQTFSGYQSMEILVPTKSEQMSPAFVLPSEPFGVSAMPQAKDGKRERVEEPPKIGGWKRMFSKGLFGKKNSIKTREIPPELPEPPKTATQILKPGKSATQTPCLDVDIPHMEMERYSVMFGSLLPPSEKSSLLARRRSRDVTGSGNMSSRSSAEDLNKQDAMAKLIGNSQPPPPPPEIPRLQVNSLKRNATTGTHLSPRSPLPKLGDDLGRLSDERRRSGSHSPPRSPVPSPLRSPGLGRSNTSAVDGRSSPLPPHFTHNDILAPLPLSHRATAVSEQSFQLSSSICSGISGKRVSRISEESSIHSRRDSFDEGDDIWMTRGGESEPTWEMVTRPSNGNEEEDDIGIAAEISIARQISISQRQLLLPVVPKNQRLVSRKTIENSMKPRLVEHRLVSTTTTKSLPTVEAAKTVETVAA